MALARIRPEDYSHSSAHLAVALGDHTRLARLISTLPRLGDPGEIRTESDSLLQEKLAEQISSALDRRDVPLRETPLHLAVRLNDISAVRSLASAGADVSLQNAAGWNPLQEAICGRRSDIAAVLLRHHHRAAWQKWRRRLPRLVAALQRMRDFYMEMSFHFESSFLPFVGRIAPSDTYRVWKRGADLRADTSLAGFDGLKIQRTEQSFIFIGDGDRSLGLSPGSLLVLNREDKTIIDAFENAGAPLSPSDEAEFSSQTNVYRPGIDVTRAELIARTNWWKHDRIENVGEWKAKIYEIHNVEFTFKTRKATAATAVSDSIDADDCDDHQRMIPLVIKEDEDDDGFLVAENPNFFDLDPHCPRRYSSFERGDSKLSFDLNCQRRNSSFEKGDAKPNFDLNSRRRNSSFEKGDWWYDHNGKMKEDREWMPKGRKSVDDRRRVFDSGKKSGKKVVAVPQGATKESEYVKGLRPAVWLTEQFPLKTDELLPLLDILANKVKAVRRLRELLTTKFPPGTFPVKVSIPVVPTVRIVVTFTKFVDLQSSEQFFTPMSSPSQLQGFTEEEHLSTASSSHSKSANSQLPDPFAIPGDYTWTSLEAKSKKMKKSKSKKAK